MSLLGFSFAFGAKEKGLKNALDTTADGVDRINGLLEEQNKLTRKQRLQGFFASIANSAHLTTIAEKLEGIGQTTNNLTTSLEGTFVQMDTSVRPMVAQLGLVGKEAARMRSRIVGTAHALNVGVEQVAGAVQALETSGKEAKKVFEIMDLGLSDLVKAEKSTGISTQELTNTVTDLTQGWGLSNEKAAEFLDQFTKVSHQAGTGSVAFKQLAGKMQAIDEMFSKVGKSIPGDEIASMVLNMSKLEGAFVEVLGEAPEEASQDTLKIFQAIAGEIVNQEKMLSGLGGEFGGFFTNLVREGGFESIQEMFQVDPTQAVLALAQMEKKIQEAGDPAQLTRFHDNLAEISPSLSFLVQNVDKTQKAIDRMSMAAEGSEGALKKMAKAGFSSGRTLAENYDLAREHFMITFRSIARPQVQKNVATQIKTFERIGKRLRDMAEEGEHSAVLWKKATSIIIKRASAVNQLGIRGLTMGFEDGSERGQEFNAMLELVAETAGEVIKTLGPVAPLIAPLISGIESLGGKVFKVIKLVPGMGMILDVALSVVSAFLSWPVVLVGAMIAIVHFWDEVSATLSEALNIAGDFASSLAKRITDLDPRAIARSIIDALKGAFAFVATLLTSGSAEAGVDTTEIAGAFENFLAGVTELGLALWDFGAQFMDEILKEINVIDWKMVGETLGEIMDRAFSIAMDIQTFIVEWFQSVDWNGIYENIREVAGHVLDMFMAAIEKFDIPGKLRKYVNKIMDFSDWLFDAIRNLDIEGLVDAGMEEVVKFFDGLFSEDTTAAVGNAISDAIAKVDWEKVFNYAMMVGDVFMSIAKVLYAVLEKAVIVLGKMIYGLARILYSALAFMWRAAIAGLKDLGNWLIEQFKIGWDMFVAYLSNNVVEPLKAALFANVVDPIVSTFLSIPDKFMELGASIIDGLVTGFNLAWGKIGDWIREKFPTLSGALDDIIDRLTQIGLIDATALEISVEEKFNPSDRGAQSIAYQKNPQVEGAEKALEQLKMVNQLIAVESDPARIQELMERQGAIQVSLGNFLKFTEDKTLSDETRNLVQQIRDVLPGSEPEDPKSPLRNLAEAGSALISNIETGMIDTMPSMVDTFSLGMSDVAMWGMDAFNSKMMEMTDASILQFSTYFKDQLTLASTEAITAFLATAFEEANAIIATSGPTLARALKMTVEAATDTSVDNVEEKIVSFSNTDIMSLASVIKEEGKKNRELLGQIVVNTGSTVGAAARGGSRQGTATVLNPS